MMLMVDIPDALVPTLKESFGEMSRAMIESLAIVGYRSGRLSAYQIGQLLGHGSRWETQQFLEENEAWPGLSESDFERELNVVRQMEHA